jgi:hypothetical protein
VKRAHQKTHRIVWLLLLPILAFVIYHALEGRFDIETAYGKSDIPVEGKEVP